ncbi:MAG: DUF3037 domain-containing protein [Bacteroides sp.]|nr:DUF3037 domain-containing protein [Bacteroides sp.]
MPERHLYEYAVIRFLPKVEREEFINVGVIVFSKGCNYLKAIYFLHKEKINLFSTELEITSLEIALKEFNRICLGEIEGGPIALMDVPERFRWLTAVRSTSLQTSRPHSGFSFDLDATLTNLFEELVL